MQVSERPLGVFSRQLFLGDTLDTERIKADYDAGVLTLRIPVAEQAKPRKISIGGDRRRTEADQRLTIPTPSATGRAPGLRQVGPVHIAPLPSGTHPASARCPRPPPPVCGDTGRSRHRSTGRDRTVQAVPDAA